MPQSQELSDLLNSSGQHLGNSPAGGSGAGHEALTMIQEALRRSQSWKWFMNGARCWILLGMEWGDCVDRRALFVGVWTNFGSVDISGGFFLVSSRFDVYFRPKNAKAIGLNVPMLSGMMKKKIWIKCGREGDSS